MDDGVVGKVDRTGGILANERGKHAKLVGGESARTRSCGGRKFHRTSAAKFDGQAALGFDFSYEIGVHRKARDSEVAECGVFEFAGGGRASRRRRSWLPNRL